MRRSRASWSDLAVVALLILMFGTLSLAQINRGRETANRVKCASNLRQIGQAILLYSNDNRGAYPRTIADINNPQPTWGTPYEGNPNLKAIADPKKASPFDAKNSAALPKANDVTAALFLLLRTQDMTSAVFICPTTTLRPFDYGGGKNAPPNWTNWPGNAGIARHLTYSYQNPYPTKEAIGRGFKLNNTLGAEFAIAADMNPGVDALLKVKPGAAAMEMKRVNSANHMSDGQNILYGDGHVAWESSPFAGVNRDNIFTFGAAGDVPVASAGIIGPSFDANDSILLPTAKDVGVVDATGEFTEAAKKDRAAAIEAMRPVTPAEQEATRTRVLGTYVREADPAATMTIEEGKLTITGPRGRSYGMKFRGIARGRVMLGLFEPGEPADLKTSLIVTLTERGIDIVGGGEFAGTWTKR